MNYQINIKIEKIYLNNEAIDKIRFTEQGLEFAYNLLKRNKLIEISWQK